MNLRHVGHDWQIEEALDFLDEVRVYYRFPGLYCDYCDDPHNLVFRVDKYSYACSKHLNEGCGSKRIRCSRCGSKKETEALKLWQRISSSGTERTFCNGCAKGLLVYMDTFLLLKELGC